MKKIIVLALLSVGIGLLGVKAYINSRFSQQTRIFSEYSFLTSAWEKYKTEYISEDGRVIDYSQNSLTTSEGQSYAMLRAVWSDDKPTFDLVWEWTKVNLKRPNDHLFGWNWGERDDGSYGLQPSGGENFATDADSDIALALIFAANRWDQLGYKQEAKAILTDIWNLSTEEVNGKRYLLPGDWATSETSIILNPSYFMPYSWRIFAQVDPDRDWDSLVNPAYEILFRSGQEPLNDIEPSGLPPNWVEMVKADESLKAPTAEQLSTRYSYDAMRIPWRIALDHQWFDSQQSRDYLRSLSKLSDLYRNQGKLTSTYEHDGTPVTEYESPAMYANALGYFMVVEPNLAQEIYRDKIVSLYSNDTSGFSDSLNYYDQNWLWFSAALYNRAAPNLYQEK